MINYCLEYCEAFVLVLYLFFHHCCSSNIFSRNKTSCCCCSLVTIADTWNCKMYIAYATLTFVFSNLYISIYIYLYMYLYIFVRSSCDGLTSFWHNENTLTIFWYMYSSNSHIWNETRRNEMQTKCNECVCVQNNNIKLNESPIAFLM